MAVYCGVSIHHSSLVKDLRQSPPKINACTILPHPNGILKAPQILLDQSQCTDFQGPCSLIICHPFLSLEPIIQLCPCYPFCLTQASPSFAIYFARLTTHACLSETHCRSCVWFSSLSFTTVYVWFCLLPKGCTRHCPQHSLLSASILPALPNAGDWA